MTQHQRRAPGHCGSQIYSHSSPGLADAVTRMMAWKYYAESGGGKLAGACACVFHHSCLFMLLLMLCRSTYGSLAAFMEYIGFDGAARERLAASLAPDSPPGPPHG